MKIITQTLEKAKNLTSELNDEVYPVESFQGDFNINFDSYLYLKLFEQDDDKFISFKDGKLYHIFFKKEKTIKTKFKILFYNRNCNPKMVLDVPFSKTFEDLYLLSKCSNKLNVDMFIVKETYDINKKIIENIVFKIEF